MADHICYKELEISEIGKDVKRLLHLIEGNGKKGLVDDLQSTKDYMNNFRWQVIIGFILVATGGTTSGYMFFEMLKKLMVQ